MGLFDFGKRPKSALNRDRKYFNASQEHEKSYAKSFKRRKKTYSRYDNGGEIGLEDKVKIVKNLDDHEGYTEGDVVEVIGVDDMGYYNVEGKDGTQWYVSGKEIELVVKGSGEHEKELLKQSLKAKKYVGGMRKKISKGRYANGGEIDIQEDDDVKMSFKTDFALGVYESDDEELDNEVEEIFKAGQEFEVTVFGIDEHKYSVQFGDGSVAFIRKGDVNIVSVNEYAKGGGVSYKPYGKTKGRFTLTYNANGEKQTEIWSSLEEATNNAIRYSNPKLGYTNVQIFDESGKEYLFSKGGEVAEGAILYASTGVPVRVLKYDPMFGGRVLIERADGIEIMLGDKKAQPSWRPLKKFSKEKPKRFKNGGGVGDWVVGDILKSKKFDRYVTIIVADEISGGYYAFSSHKDGRAISDEGGYGHVQFIHDFDFENWEKVGHKKLQKVSKNGLSYYKSGLNKLDMYMALLDRVRFKFFKEHAPKKLKSKFDSLENDNYHYASAELVNDFFDNPTFKNFKNYKLVAGEGILVEEVANDNFCYGGDSTDEAVVHENLVNGEIHCDILTEIIGCKPEYPHQIVGAIKLEKCFLRPYYRIS